VRPFSLKRLFLFLAILLGVLGCGHRTIWYKKGATQWDFNRDEQECIALAHKLAREATVGEKKENILVFLQAYQQCLFNKGWSPVPPQRVQEVIKRKRISYHLDLSSHVLVAFNRQIPLPSNIVFLRETRRSYGPTLIYSLFFRGKGNTFLNLILQESLERAFKDIPYPVQPCYLIYDRGSFRDRRIVWASYFGRIKGYMVMGFGAILRFSSRQRLILVVTSPMPPARGKKPAYLHLAENQMRAIESFTARWSKWVKKNLSSL